MAIQGTQSGSMVFVYRNLQKDCWSIRAQQGENRGRVVLHAKAIVLHHPVFKVSEAGRQRVIAEQRKNVHAGVEGYLLGAEDCTIRYEDEFWEESELPMPTVSGRRVSYNPYRSGYFYYADDQEFVHDLHDFAMLDGNGKVFVSPNQV